MNPSTILVWNVRGLNNRDRRNSVRDVVISSNADIICLQETKVIFSFRSVALRTIISLRSWPMGLEEGF